jgi:hypothetical protein
VWGAGRNYITAADWHSVVKGAEHTGHGAAQHATHPTRSRSRAPWAGAQRLSHRVRGALEACVSREDSGIHRL